MKIASLPRPSRAELGGSPLHVIVRDFPETLAELRGAGVPVQELGHRRLGEIEDASRLLDRLEASVAWRRSPLGG